MTIKLPNDYPYDEIDSVLPKFDIQLSINDFKEEAQKAFLSAIQEQTCVNLYPGKKHKIEIEPLKNGEPLESAKGRIRGSAIIPCSCPRQVRFCVILIHVSLYLLFFSLIDRLSMNLNILENRLI